MNTGELLTRWTVRLAFLLYLAALAARMPAWKGRPKPGAARWLWTAGALLFLVHVVCAFSFYHHWSHTAAYEATAQRTAEVTHLAWGGGLYLNYAFTGIWLADAAWWWSGLDSYRNRPGWVDWPIQIFMAFMFFNATLVFGQGVIRWLAGAGGAGLLLLWLLGRRNREE